MIKTQNTTTKALVHYAVLASHRVCSILNSYGLCGNLGCSDGVAIGASQHRGGNGTSEPDLARTSCHCLGQTVVQVPVS